MRSSVMASLVFPVLVTACTPSTSPVADAGPKTATPESTASATTESPATTSAPPAAPTAKAPAPAIRYTGVFATPESVMWDEENDRYLVANIQGCPLEADNNGFISELSPDGTVKQAKWIAGGQNKVTLDAPKGMAIAGGVLYVADITTVRLFDAKSGAPKGEVKIPGATFLNDMAAGPDGKVYVSDSGLKAGAKGFDPTGTDAVYVVDKGQAKPIAKSADLGRPNGLLVTDKGVLVVTFGSGELYRLDDKGARQDVLKLPKGSLDGIVAVGDSLLVSSWESPGIFRGKVGGTFELLVADVKAPADIGFDKKRNRVLVPRFSDDAIEAYDVK